MQSYESLFLRLGKSWVLRDVFLLACTEEYSMSIMNEKQWAARYGKKKQCQFIIGIEEDNWNLLKSSSWQKPTYMVFVFVE